jgi:hypothetical protein
MVRSYLEFITDGELWLAVAVTLFVLTLTSLLLALLWAAATSKPEPSRLTAIESRLQALERGKVIRTDDWGNE